MVDQQRCHSRRHHAKRKWESLAEDMPEYGQEILDPRKTETALAAPEIGKQNAKTDALTYYCGTGCTPYSHPQRANKQEVKTGIDDKGYQH